MKIYRWHICRKLDGSRPPADSQDMVDVTITPATEEFVKFIMESGAEKARDTISDELTWWHIGERYELEGTTNERYLLEALTYQNIRSEELSAETTDRNRGIVEDMVFLQLVEDEEVYEKLWKKLRETGGWPDVSDLARVKGARWLDHTQSSRRMVKDLYLKMLGEFDDTEEEANAFEQRAQSTFHQRKSR